MQAARKKRFPLRVLFELTYRCNFKCGYCYVPESYKRMYKDELTTREVFSILDQLAEIGCLYLGFTGGEPFLREDFFDILTYAKKKGFQIIIHTNGSCIDEEKADLLMRLALNKVDIALQAMSEISFERISGVPGSCERVFRAIELLGKRGINLSFKTCVLKENTGEIAAIRNFVRRLSAVHRLDDLLSPRLDGSRRPYQHRGMMRHQEIMRLLSDRYKRSACVQARRPGKQQGYPEEAAQLPSPRQLFRCGAGISQAVITPAGELKLCLMIDYPKYKILDSSLREAWDGCVKIIDSVVLDGTFACVRCSLRDYCKWCPGRGWLHARDFTACDPECRKRARSLRGFLERLAR